MVPAEVATLQDHADTYSEPPWREHAARLLGRGTVSLGALERRSVPRSLAALQDVLAGAGLSPLRVDLSGGDPELEAAPVHVARALVPGMVPIWFGVGLEAFGLPRLRSLPVELGLRKTRLSVDQLERQAHPFT